MLRSRAEILRIIGFGVATGGLSAVFGMAAYALLLPLQLSYDPVTHLPHEPSSFAPLILSIAQALVTAVACFMVSGSRGASDGLRIGTVAGLTLCAGWFSLELSRGESPADLLHWSYFFVIALLGISGAFASFARRRLSQTPSIKP